MEDHICNLDCRGFSAMPAGFLTLLTLFANHILRSRLLNLHCSWSAFLNHWRTASIMHARNLAPHSVGLLCLQRQAPLFVDELLYRSASLTLPRFFQLCSMNLTCSSMVCINWLAQGIMRSICHIRFFCPRDVGSFSVALSCVRAPPCCFQFATKLEPWGRLPCVRADCTARS